MISPDIAEWYNKGDEIRTENINRIIITASKNTENPLRALATAIHQAIEKWAEHMGGKP